jgi:nucleoside-diphosphate-sugar epimerase
MILVTGSTGFVGNALVKRLHADQSFDGVIAAVRRTDISLPRGVRAVQVGSLSAATNWCFALRNVDAIVHCAARVHVMLEDDVVNALEAFREVNVDATLNLAGQAAQAGVRIFVFVSSIKVNGESTRPGLPFTAVDVPAPFDAYGISKWEAERGLRKIEEKTGMKVVIVRSPLVYGPKVRANFALMLRWLVRGFPLPLGAVYNARSMVALENLVDLLVVCLKHPAAGGETFLVSDGEDLSTTELLRRSARAMGKKAFLLPVPVVLLEIGAALLGKRAVAQRLCGSLQVDIEKTRRLLDWKPPLTVDEGLKRAVEGMTQ